MLKTYLTDFGEGSLCDRFLVSPGCLDFLFLCHVAGVGGFADRDSSWLHGEYLEPCVRRDRLTAPPDQGAYCLRGAQEGLHFPVSIFCGLV